jgi:hypothetical protein
MPFPCFSYPSEVAAPSSPRRTTTTHCLSHLADLNRMTYTACFSYPADVPSGPRRHDAPQPAPPGLHKMSYTTCFRY